MQHPGLVSVRDGLRDFLHQPGDRNLLASALDPRTAFEHSRGRQRVFRHARRQAAALDIFHREERLAVAFADLVDRQDVRVIESRCRFGFALETLDVGRRSQSIRKDELQRDHTVQARLACLVHHAHAAPAQFTQQFVIREGSQ
jgi:hypothetical protein